MFYYFVEMFGPSDIIHRSKISGKHNKVNKGHRCRFPFCLSKSKNTQRLAKIPRNSDLPSSSKGSINPTTEKTLVPHPMYLINLLKKFMISTFTQKFISFIICLLHIWLFTNDFLLFTYFSILSFLTLMLFISLVELTLFGDYVLPMDDV